MFVAEPAFLLHDEVREPGTHLAILKAIGAGNHTLSEIVHAALIGQSHLPAYLARLRELRLVERRLPVTVPLPGGGTPGVAAITSATPTFVSTFASLPHTRTNWPTVRNRCCPAWPRNCAPLWA